ncbi:MAG TPA: hypothetical protein VE957_08410 [Terriglobales bacterium]|nr:hypothetical protein [Terriglobales bacterium]
MNSSITQPYCKGCRCAASNHPTNVIHQTLQEAQLAAREIRAQGAEEVVADKEYHSGGVLQATAPTGFTAAS